jgi:hypothetical protein
MLGVFWRGKRHFFLGEGRVCVSCEGDRGVCLLGHGQKSRRVECGKWGLHVDPRSGARSRTYMPGLVAGPDPRPGVLESMAPPLAAHMSVM